MADWGERESPRWRGVARGAVDVSSDANELLQGPARDFDFPALLAIADSLPLMIAYCDLDLTYRFVNRPMARWMAGSRSTRRTGWARAAAGARRAATRGMWRRESLGIL